MSVETLKKKVRGCLTAGLIGDAMGAPVENWNYKDIEAKYNGRLEDFSGAGTDDSAIKLILCDALINHGGHITADEFAESFLKLRGKYSHLFFIPVKNMLLKLIDRLTLPVYAGIGNMQSSSSAMSISPMGIVNACDPRQAAIETYDVAGLIHAGDSTFCRDAACAVAAAVAEAMKPEATVESVLEASTAYLHPVSSAVMIDCIGKALEMAKNAGSYEAFREEYYKTSLHYLACDSRETVPAVLALFALAKGDPTTAIIYGANFGRDADTIGTMVGALAGAFRGIDAIRPEWVEKVEAENSQLELTEKMTAILLSRMEEKRAVLAQLEAV